MSVTVQTRTGGGERVTGHRIWWIIRPATTFHWRPVGSCWHSVAGLSPIHTADRRRRNSTRQLRRRRRRCVLGFRWCIAADPYVTNAAAPTPRFGARAVLRSQNLQRNPIKRGAALKGRLLSVCRERFYHFCPFTDSITRLNAARCRKSALSPWCRLDVAFNPCEYDWMRYEIDIAQKLWRIASLVSNLKSENFAYAY